MRRIVAFVAVLAAALPAVAQDIRPGLGAAGELRGQLTPRRFTTLSSEVAGRVARMSVREGERFKDGQVLVSLDCSIQNAQLERAVAVQASAERLHTSHRQLHEQKVAGRLDAENAAMEAAKARGEAQVMQATIAKCAIKAPFAGRVVEQKAREQQFVQPGTALLDVLDDSVLELEFLMPSRALPWLKPGHPFQIHIEEMGRAYPAKISRIGARVDAVSQSIKVAGEVTGTFPELMAGMSGKIQIAPP